MPATTAAVEEKRAAIDRETARFASTQLQPSAAASAALEARGSAPIRVPTTLATLLRRPELGFADVLAVAGVAADVDEDVAAQVEISMKYGGYVSRQERAIERARRLEEVRFPAELDYQAIRGLSNEVREKLETVRPRTLGQASRIAGMTPAALSLLAVHLRRAGHA